MDEPRSATIGAAPGIGTSGSPMPPALPEPPDWLLAYFAIQLLHPGEKLAIRFEPLESERPVYWKVITALREEKDAFFRRMRQRVKAIKRGEERAALSREEPQPRDVLDVVIHMLAAQLPAEMLEHLQELYRMPIEHVRSHGGDTEPDSAGSGDTLQQAV
jgi:hypothetical protein